MANYQTLSEFLAAPFFTRNSVEKGDYENKYQNFKRNDKIKLKWVLNHDGRYYYHLLVPSESNTKRLTYDVVIEFFTEDETISKDITLNRYFIKFFSNSPSFVYRFATLYNLEGYLIEELEDKFVSEHISTLPTKSNADLKLGYDKSIYYALRYLSDSKYFILTKLSTAMHNAPNAEKFFEGISDFEGKMIDITMSEANKLLDNEKKAEHKKTSQLPPVNPIRNLGKIVPKLSTVKRDESSSGIKSSHKSKTGPKSKKTASSSTTHNKRT